jgi:hypothetical protein
LEISSKGDDHWNVEACLGSFGDLLEDEMTRGAEHDAHEFLMILSQRLEKDLFTFRPY